jgi:DNA processing protein
MRAGESIPPKGGDVQTSGACEDCLRRSWLLALLGPVLDYRSRDRERLIELLALEDGDLLQALGGRRRRELKARYADLTPRELPAGRFEAVCRHDGRYPRALTDGSAPRMLNVAGGVERLAELSAAPVVAIAGSRRASDYGIEMAKSLGRGLAASGVTVTSGLADGIAAAAHRGAQEVGGRALAVMPGGLDVACPVRRRSLFERVKRRGCIVAELPGDCPPRRWGQVASERILAGLAGLMVVVEADESPAELASARIGRGLQRTVAAVPGRVTSELSRGTHALLMGGAPLVRGAEDALELLCQLGVPAPAAQARTGGSADGNLEPRLRETLERVGAGQDTPDKLTRGAQDGGDMLLALSELELMGLLARGDGGRYVLRDGVAIRFGRPTEGVP